MPVVLSFIGKKGAGRSEVLEKVVGLLSAKGIRVGVIKHLAKDNLEIDEPGKDTYRYREKGARQVVLAGRRRLALFANFDEPLPLEELLSFFRGFEIVLLEGFMEGTVPKIEVHRKGLGPLLLEQGADNVVAVCSDDERRADTPHFALTEISALADFIASPHLNPPPALRGEERRGK